MNTSLAPTAQRFYFLCVLCFFASFSRPCVASCSAVSFTAFIDCIAADSADANSVLFDSTRATEACEASVSEGLRRADSLLSGLAVARGNDRDPAMIDSLALKMREIHADALTCQAHLTAMMVLAASETTRKLTQSSNVLMFRMGVRDARLFLDEARRYWKERR